MDYLPIYEFRQCVERYSGNYKIKSFSCWDQFLSMAFAQLTYRESLRDIQACLRAAKQKTYHMGIRGKISRNTLAHANQTRDWHIYADFAQTLIRKARQLYADDLFGIELEQTIYALDSTTIDLCLSLFPWATFRKHKGAVKLHTLLDLRGNIPTIAFITSGKVHEVNILDKLPIEAGAIYIMDRGYLDYARLYKLNQSAAYFVTRAKNNARYHRRYYQKIDKTSGLKSDQVITLHGYYSKQDYPERLRRIAYYDEKQNKKLVFLTNNFTLPALTITEIYRQTLADRVILQMDQTASANQGVLWNIRECSQNTNMDCYLRLRAGCHYQKAIESGAKPLHNFTNCQCDAFRENTAFTSAYRC